MIVESFIISLIAPLISSLIWALYKLIYFKEFTSSNILTYSVTCNVLKLDISKYSKEVQPEKIYSILFTDDESKCDKSIYAIFIAFESLDDEKKLFKEVIGSEKYISIVVFASIVNSVFDITYRNPW